MVKDKVVFNKALGRQVLVREFDILSNIDIQEYLSNEDADDFLKEITNGRYPSGFVLSYETNAEPEEIIRGGLFVFPFRNPEWKGDKKLYVFGTKIGNLENTWKR